MSCVMRITWCVSFLEPTSFYAPNYKSLLATSRWTLSCLWGKLQHWTKNQDIKTSHNHISWLAKRRQSLFLFLPIIFLSFLFYHPPHKSSIIIQQKRFFIYYISLLLSHCPGNCSSSFTKNTIPCLLLRLQWQACKLSRWLSRSDENFEGEDSSTKKSEGNLSNSSDLIRKSKQKRYILALWGWIKNSGIRIIAF